MQIWKWTMAGALTILVGCGSSRVSTPTAKTGNQPDASPYLAAAEPDSPLPVGEARETVADKQDITLVGTIGGSVEPFVEGLAAFTIVDPKVPCCAPDEGCPTPWDYCCMQDQVEDNIATVKMVDAAGSPVAEDARTLLGVKELSTVVVQGTASRDEEGNLTVAATKVFVRPSE